MSLAISVAFVLFASWSAEAQTNDEIFPAFQWNFATPGARANAMGGAFLGLADDATASTSNPAGLVSLTRPQIQLEYKRTRLENARLASPASLFNGQQTSFPATFGTPSFLSASFPVGSRATLGVARHEFLNLRESFNLDPRAVPGPGPSQGTNTFLFPVRGSVDLKGVSYAAALAVALSDQVSIGGTFAYTRLSADAEATRFNGITLPGWCSGGCNEQNVRNVATSDVIANRTSIAGDDHDYSVTIGFRASPSPRVSIGAVYSYAPSFELFEEFSLNPGFVLRPCCGTNRPLVPAVAAPIPVKINVPHRIGGGVAVRPTNSILLTADVVRIQYSRLTEDVAVIFNRDTNVGQSLQIEDTTELHVGGEFRAVGGRRPLLVRAGVFTNPSHLMRFKQPPAGLDPTLASQYAAIYNLPSDRTEVNGTIGLGFVVIPEFQIDVAYVGLSQRTPARREVVVSTAIRFGS